MGGVLLLILLWALSGPARGELPTTGYCIGTVCFALFKPMTDFEGAQDICSQQRGHLMTVRTTVAHDTLTLLLANTTEPHYIGLHLPKGCPDASSELLGYQWITKDSSSNFFNWADASSFDTCDPSVPRCVTVSKDTQFQWEEDHCTEVYGFLCEYSFQGGGCSHIKVPSPAIYHTPYGFRIEDAITLPPGSIVELPDEKKAVCVSGDLLPAPWSCEIERGGCEHRCTSNPENEPVCYCPPGFVINPENRRTCEVAVDDPCKKLDCEHACYVHSDSFLCTCHDGFVLSDDKRSCIDLNECSDERQCPENQKCINTHGWFKCVCEDGYQSSGGVCVDVDECASAPCEHLCNNNQGGYDCSCYDGYKVDPESPDKCKLHCGREECVAECDPNNKYHCYCPDGYILEEGEDYSVCIDLDECEFFHDCEQHCENSFGGYVCFCDRGYTLVDKTRCEKGSGTEEVTDVMDVVTVEPTRRPSGVSVGAFVGIIICTVFFIVLAVFLIHYVLCGKMKTDNPEPLKAAECPEAHTLQQVSTDTAS